MARERLHVAAVPGPFARHWRDVPPLARLWLRLRRKMFPITVFVIVAVLLIWPAAMLVIGAFRSAPPGQPAQWTLAAIGGAFTLPGTSAAILNSLILSVVTTAIGVCLAAVFAYLSERTDAPFRRLITPAMVLIFATPPLFYAIGCDLVANRYSGILNGLARAVAGPEVTLVNVESWLGLLAVTTFRATAFVYLFLFGAFRSLDRVPEDASRVCGAGWPRTMLLVNLPILGPALTGAALLGLVAGFQSFDTALIIGEPAGIRVIGTHIYYMLSGYPMAKYAEASVLSTLLIIVVGALCLIQARLLGRRSFVTIGGKAGTTKRQRLGRWGPVVGAFILLYFLITEVVPTASIVFSSLQRFPGVYNGLTLMHYARALSATGVPQALRTTVILSIVVGGLTMALAVAIVQVSRRLGRTSAAFLRFTTLLPFAMPGIVCALAVTWAYVSLPGVRAIYGTIWLFILALIIVVMPFTMQTAQAATEQIGPELQEAARVAGASAVKGTVDILGRLIAPSFVSGWFVAGVYVAGNLDVPLLLGSPGMTTVSALVYSFYGQGLIGDAAALLLALAAGLALASVLGVLLRSGLKARKRTALASARTLRPLPT